MVVQLKEGCEFPIVGALPFVFFSDFLPIFVGGCLGNLSAARDPG
jgi:hypothetical protein